MSDDRAKIILDGDVSPLRQKLREAADGLKRFGDEGEQAVGRLSGPLATLQAKFVAIGALLAGGTVFKEAVGQTVKLTEESTKLGRALGISAGEASTLREALDAGNTSQDEFVGAAKGLAKQVRENEDGLQAMGLKTRDAAGQLRPLTDLTLDAIGVLNGYRAGTDRAIAGQALFGKGFEMTSNLAEMNNQAVADTTEKMRALGMVVSQENVAAWKAFDDAGDDASLTLKGIKTTIGNALLPALTDLGNWFSSIGPAAITVIRGAFGGLVAVFHGLTMSVTILWETLNAMVVTVAEPIRALGESLVRLMDRDVEGARAALANIGPNIKAAWATAFDEIEKRAQTTRDRLWNLFAEGTPTVAPPKGGKSADGLIKRDKEKQDDPSFMGTYEARLAEIKNFYEQENVLRQFSKEQELAYWRELQQSYTLTAKDQLAIAKRTATLEVEIRRQALKDQRALDAVMIDHRRGEAAAQVAIEEQAAHNAHENQSISKTRLIELEQDFARRRFEIEYQAQIERYELLKDDPNVTPAALALAKEQMLEIERNYQLRRGELLQQATIESNSIWTSLTDTMTGLWDKGVNALINGTLTWSNAVRAIGTEMVKWFATEVVGKKVKEWLAGKAKMLAAKLGFAAQEKAIETASAATTMAIKSSESTSVIASNAAEAGSGAAASQASIPIVGPMLALAAMAAIFAAVMAIGKKKSAARGYDIPKGLNPMTQLHEEEMVLPQKYADVIRGLAGRQGGEEGGAPGATHITIQALDARSVERLFKDEGSALVAALRNQARGFSRL